MAHHFYDPEMAAQQARLARTRDMVRQRRVLIGALSPKRSEAILELGAGNGALARDLVPLVGAGGRIVGIDTSDAIVALARDLCPDAAFLLGDARHLSFQAGSFDAVVAAQLFCFLDDADGALRDVHRVLKPGGRVVVLDTDWATLVWRSRNPALMNRVMAAYTAHYRDPHVPRSLPERLARAGFTDIALDSFVILDREFGEDSYARQTANFAIPIMEGSSAFTPDDIAAWIDDLDDLARHDGFFFSLNRYVATASKPP
jgi:ubiquinone/menaquinone biosynthesis C-methylase UbiE